PGVAQPAAMDEPETRARLRFGESIANQSLGERVGDADARRAGAQNHHLLIPQSPAGSAYRGKNRSRRDRRGALNVVVEGNQLVAIAVQDRSRVRLGEVFPLQKRSEEHTSELQSRGHLVCRLLLEK